MSLLGRLFKIGKPKKKRPILPEFDNLIPPPPMRRPRDWRPQIQDDEIFIPRGGTAAVGPTGNRGVTGPAGSMGYTGPSIGPPSEASEGLKAQMEKMQKKMDNMAKELRRLQHNNKLEFPDNNTRILDL